jgi:hypothetical protein
VIPNLLEIARRLGVSATLLPIVLLGLLTGLLVLAQAALRPNDRKN